MSAIHELVNQHQQFFRTGVTKDLDYRLNALKNLQHSIKSHEQEILDALKKDLNKSDFEGYATELGMVYEELKTAIRKVPDWAKKKRVRTPLMHFLSSSFLYPEPYGTVLIMSPWNYPFQLALIPLIGAVAAGNCCVVKPSEYSFYTSEVVEQIVQEVFDPRHVSVIRGGRAANQSLLEEKFDYIFFTGSPAVGHTVMEAAARHLTPLTLELGGKSPCIVDETADISLAAKRIIWGKLLNAGQTCIAPDYILVHKNVKSALIAEMKKTILHFYGQEPQKDPSYPCIINQKHFDRLRMLMKDGTIVQGGNINPETRQIAPTIIEGIHAHSPIMQEEIFGPLLPVLSFENIADARSFVAERPKPLALYLFSRNKAVIAQTMKELSFGGGCINDTITHIANPNLPFGGVGESGMGQYHGYRSFEIFTHQKAVLQKSNIFDVPLRYPPFKDDLSLLKKIMK